jgi:hypothetical protein
MNGTNSGFFAGTFFDFTAAFRFRDALGLAGVAGFWTGIGFVGEVRSMTSSSGALEHPDEL